MNLLKHDHLVEDFVEILLSVLPLNNNSVCCVIQKLNSVYLNSEIFKDCIFPGCVALLRTTKDQTKIVCCVKVKVTFSFMLLIINKYCKVHLQFLCLANEYKIDKKNLSQLAYRWKQTYQTYLPITYWTSKNEWTWCVGPYCGVFDFYEDLNGDLHVIPVKLVFRFKIQTLLPCAILLRQVCLLSGLQTIKPWKKDHM